MAHLAFSLRGRAARRILVRGCGWLAGRGRCRAVARRVVWADLVIVGGAGLGVWARAACDAERTWDASPEFSLARGLRPEGRLLLPLSTPVSIRGY